LGGCFPPLDFGGGINQKQREGFAGMVCRRAVIGGRVFAAGVARPVALGGN